MGTHQPVGRGANEQGSPYTWQGQTYSLGAGRLGQHNTAAAASREMNFQICDGMLAIIIRRAYIYIPSGDRFRTTLELSTTRCPRLARLAKTSPDLEHPDYDV